MKILDKVQQIEQHALNSDDQTRVVSNMKLSQAVRQGDVYLVKIEKDVSGLKPLNGTQLVPGTTKGSRHCAESPARLFEDDGAEIKGIAPTALRGPVVDSPERFEVSHPEHAHISLPGGTYQALYQLDFKAQQRVAD